MNRFLLMFGSCAMSVAATAMAQPTTAPTATPILTPTLDATAATGASLERATADAVARLYTLVASERIEGLPISELLDRVGGREVVLDGLARAEQIGGPREVADGFVQINLEISGTRAAALITQAVNAAPDKSPIAARRLAKLLSSWSERSFSSTGDNVDLAMRRGQPASDSLVAQTQAARLTLPDIQPSWTRDAHTISAIAPAAGSQLRTARAAEKLARTALRDQLGKLMLDDHTSLSLAGRQSQTAIDLAAAAAKISAVDYRADGSVKVDVTIDGQQLWQTLQLVASR